MKLEQLLPYNDKLDTLFEHCYDDAIVEIEKLRDDITGDIVNHNFELNSDGLIIYASLASEGLRRWVYESDDIEVQSVLYRSMIFGFMAAAHYGGVRQVNFMHFVKYAQNDEPLESYTEEVGEYLADNPNVDMFVSHYGGELDTSQRQDCRHIAELAAASMFMLVERSMGDDYVTARQKTMSVSDFNSVDDNPERSLE